MMRAVLTSMLLLAGMTPLRADEKTPASPGETAAGEARPAGDEPASTHRVFELRTYYTNEGKLTDLHKRFRDHTCRLLKQHGAELVGFWTPLDDKDGKGSQARVPARLPQPRGGQEDLGGVPERPRVAEGLRGKPQERRSGQEGRIRLPRADRLQRDEVISPPTPRRTGRRSVRGDEAPTPSLKIGLFVPGDRQSGKRGNDQLDHPGDLRVITIIDIGPITIIDGPVDARTRYRWLLLCSIWG